MPARCCSGPLDEQVRSAVELLEARGALEHESPLGAVADVVPPARAVEGRAVVVVVEPDRRSTPASCSAPPPWSQPRSTATRSRSPSPPTSPLGSRCGAPTRSSQVEGTTVEDDAARALGDWVVDTQPWAVLAPSTAWGREVASRAAARAGAGLTGDAVGLEVDASATGWSRGSPRSAVSSSPRSRPPHRCRW